ncbi:hypothetical protein JGU66_26970 [Myxococcaceae bacterium JPH2]|nr:hypothetical protein [Myxococcaceae bacterium JPH2]
MLVKPLPNIHDPLPDGRTNPSISADWLYVVTSIGPRDYRVVDVCGEPILIPISLFEVVDDWLPSDWVREVTVDESDEWVSWGRPELLTRGFFERWHDGDVRAMRLFAEIYAELWRHHAPQLLGQPYVLKDGM